MRRVATLDDGGTADEDALEMTSPTRLSMVIPSQGKPRHLDLVLQALRDQVACLPCNSQIVLVLDPEDPTRPEYDQVLEAWGQGELEVVWYSGHNRSEKRNAGLDCAMGEVVLLLDDDCLPESGFLRAHLASHELEEPHFAVSHVLALTKELTAGLVERRLQGLEEINASRLVRLSRMARGAEEFWGDGIHRPPLPVWILFVTRCVSFRRDCAVRFDERFRGWGIEDWEYGLRLSERGLGVRILKGPRLFHLAHPASPGQQSDLIQNLGQLLRLHPRPDVFLAVRFDPRSLGKGLGEVQRKGEVSFRTLTLSLLENATAPEPGRGFTRSRWRLRAEAYLRRRAWAVQPSTDDPAQPDCVATESARMPAGSTGGGE
jgi:hypothetical protein